MRNTITFLGLVLLSYLGDTLAVMAIPLVLYNESGDLVSSSIFSILALLSTVLVAVPSAKLIKKIHPLKVILIFDSLAVALLFLFSLIGRKLAAAEPNYFLGMCFAIAVVINFPMFAKYQLMHKYFIAEKNLDAFSSIQGRLFALVFVLSVMLFGISYEYFKFAGVMVVDAISYLPLLMFCYWHRNKDVVLKNDVEKRSTKGLSICPSERHAQVAHTYLYYLFCLFTVLFGSIQSHLLLVILVSVFNDATIEILSISVGGGVMLSLIFGGFIQKIIGPSVVFSISAIVALLCVSGYFISIFHSYYSVVLLGFSLSEIRGICLMQQRRMQNNIESFYDTYNMAKYSNIFSCLIASVLLYGLVAGINTVGLFLPIVILSIFIALSGLLPQVFFKRLKGLKNIVLLVIIGLAHSLFAPNKSVAFEYNTVMLDRP